MHRHRFVFLISAAAFAWTPAAFAAGSGNSIGQVGGTTTGIARKLPEPVPAENVELMRLLDAAVTPPIGDVSYALAINHPQKGTTLHVSASGGEKVLKLTGRDGAVIGEWKLSPGMDAAALSATQEKVKAAFALPVEGPVRGIAKGVSSGH